MLSRHLKELDKAKDSFLSIASHELRTPMTAIKGYIDLMLSGHFGHLDERQKHFLGRIFHRTDELLDLINDMLDISRLEANRMQFRLVDIRAFDLMKDVVADYGAICAKKHIKIKLENPDKFNIKMKTDAEKLKEIFNNLIGNAYKFTPEKESITVRLRKPKNKPGFVQFEVQDTGIGIPKDQFGAIFEKFRQVENYLQKSQKGTGLGLSITKGMIDKLGGEIWVESTLGKGSTFFFTLPIKPPKI
jgi:signal transduction histidine kinase